MSTTAGAAALTIPWPEAFQDPAASDPCTSDGLTGTLHIPDIDDETIVVDVPIVCAGGEWRVPVGQPLPDDTRLAMLACVDELVSLEPGESCDETVDRLTLETDPAAFLTRRQLQTMAFQISHNVAQVAMDPDSTFPPEFEGQAAGIVEMLNAYAELGAAG